MTIALLLSCGGAIGDVDGSTDHDGSGADANEAGDVTIDSPCESVEGYAVCGGSYACSPANCCEGGDTAPTFCGPPYAYPFLFVDCGPGPYGAACLEVPIGNLTTWTALDFDGALLLAANGGGDQLRYADLSTWTGDPLPEPATCPDLGPNVQPCGSSCGTCPAGETCYGGSPIHPVGYCGAGTQCSADGTLACSSGQACFTFTVQPDAQADADGAGRCFDQADCDALASNLPGGGKCTASQ